LVWRENFTADQLFIVIILAGNYFFYAEAFPGFFHQGHIEILTVIGGSRNIFIGGRLNVLLTGGDRFALWCLPLFFLQGQKHTINNFIRGIF